MFPGNVIPQGGGISGKFFFLCQSVCGQGCLQLSDFVEGFCLKARKTLAFLPNLCYYKSKHFISFILSGLSVSEHHFSHSAR